MEEHSEDHLILEDYWRIIWNRKWMIGLFVFTTTLVVLIVSFLMTPIYEASATLHIKEQMPSLLGGDFLGSGISTLSTKEEINTQIEILKSRSVLEDVITKLDLIEKFEIEKEPGEEERRKSALANLRKAISVSHIANTQLIRVSIRSNNPELSGEIVNSISEAFIERNVESKRGEANAVLAFVSGQVDQVSEKLKIAEEDLLKYKQSEGIGVLDEEARLKVDRLAQLESSYQEVKVAREILDTRITVVLNQMGLTTSTDVPLASVSSNPAVRKMQDQVTELQKELTRLEGGSSSDSQRASEIKARIDSLKREIQVDIARAMGASKVNAVNSALQMQLADYKSQDIVLAAQENALVNLIEIHEEDINKLPAREISLIRLERARRINDELYAALMRAKNEAQIEAASQIGNIDVIDPAITPLVPVLPKKKENVIIGLVVSLILGISLAFLLEYLDKNVKTEDEVKKLLGIPILGLIPRLDMDGHRHGLNRGQKSVAGFTLVTRDNPKSSASEAFRLLRTNLRFTDLDKGLKTVVVTSPIPGEGKTTIAANLSITLAAQDERILIVDADFKIPAVHKIFNLPDSPGITNILSEGTSYQSIIHKIDGVENLDVLTCGKIPPNSSEILGSSRMKELIDELRDGYDRIIFDVPPVIGATDAVVLSSILDGVLLVLRVGEIDKRALKRTKEIFDNAKIKILGGILNGVDPRDSRYGYGYSYYYETPEKRDGDSY